MWRRIFHKYWWRLGWSSEHCQDRSHWTWAVCLSNVNRPYLNWEWQDRECRYICLSWGNNSGDPVWSIGYQW